MKVQVLEDDVLVSSEMLAKIYDVGLGQFHKIILLDLF